MVCIAIQLLFKKSTSQLAKGASQNDLLKRGFSVVDWRDVIDGVHGILCTSFCFRRSIADGFEYLFAPMGSS